MTEEEGLRIIQITNFFDPSLFWFIYEDDLDPRDEFHRSLQRFMKKNHSVIDKPEENSIVAVHFNGKWHRAQIKCIIPGENRPVNIVHLIDEGLIERFPNVYALPKQFCNIPSFCKKGMLYGVQKTRVDYNLQNTNVKHSDSWSEKSISSMQDVLADPDTVIKFDKKMNVLNTEIGDIYIEGQNEINGDLSDYLVKKGCAVIDETNFKLGLLNALSEEAEVKKIVATYNANQKRQRSKSVCFREPIEEKISDKPSENLSQRHRSTSESRESRNLNYKTVLNERKLILEKVGIQSGRQSRQSKFLSEKTTIGIHDSKSGVEIPSQRPKVSPKSLATVRGRGKKSNESFESSLESSPEKPKTIPRSEKLRMLTKKKSATDSTIKPLQICVNVKNSERSVTLKPDETKKSISDRFGALMSKEKSPKSHPNIIGRGKKIKKPEIDEEYYDKRTIRGRSRRISYDSTSDSFSDVFDDVTSPKERKMIQEIYHNQSNSSCDSSSDAFDDISLQLKREMSPKFSIENGERSYDYQKSVKKSLRNFRSTSFDEESLKLKIQKSQKISIENVERVNKNNFECNSPAIEEQSSKTRSSFSKESFTTFSKGRAQKLLSSTPLIGLKPGSNRAKLGSEQNFDDSDKDFDVFRTMSKGRGYTKTSSKTDSIVSSENSKIHKNFDNTSQLPTSNFDSPISSDQKSKTQQNFDNAHQISSPSSITSDSDRKNSTFDSKGRGYRKTSLTICDSIVSDQKSKSEQNFDNAHQISSHSSAASNSDKNTKMIENDSKNSTFEDNFDKSSERSESSTMNRNSNFRTAGISSRSSVSSDSDRKNTTFDSKGRGYKTSLATSDSNDQNSRSQKQNFDNAHKFPSRRSSFASDSDKNTTISNNERNKNSTFEGSFDKSSECSESARPKSIFEGMTTNRNSNIRPAGMLLTNYNNNNRSRTSDNGMKQTYRGRGKSNYDTPDGINRTNRSSRSTRSSEDESSLNENWGRKGINKSSSNDNLSDTSQSESSKSRVIPGNFKYDENDEKNYDLTPTCVISRLKMPHCLCDRCTSWRDTNDPIWDDTKTEPKPAIKKRPKRPMSPILRTDGFEKSLIAEPPYMNAVFDKFVAPKVLVHCPMTLQPVTRVNESTFHPEVIKSMLRLNYEKSHRIQAYSWCAIARGFHTIIINGPKSGKTMSYIPPMCSEVLFTEDNLKPEFGPHILVIVPGVVIGEYINNLMCRMYYCSKFKPKVILAVPPLTNHVRTQIVSGVDILIATPKLLIKLLKAKDTRLKRLKGVIFEEIDTLLKNFPTEIESVLQLLNNFAVKSTLEDAIKMVFVGTQWTPSIENLAKRLKRPPAICIGAHLEAALYGRININVKFIESGNKDIFVGSLIEKNKKTVIICNTNEEILKLRDILVHFNPLYLEENCDIDYQKGVQTIWETPSIYRVLICNDFILNTDVFVNISDSETVIQYSLPESWTLFSNRFARFSNNFGSPLYDFDDKKGEFNMNICVDENCNVQFDKMVKFLQRFNKNLPKEIIDLYEKRRYEKENQKIVENVDLCDNVKLFGSCEDSENCSFRHIVDERDTLTNLPKSGIVTLKILHIHDVTQFSVRLIQHIDSKNETHDIVDEFSKVQLMLMRLCNEEVRRNVSDVFVGTICAIEESSKVYRRVKVTKIIAATSTNVPTKVQVKLLDIGARYNVKVNDLFVFPSKELYKIPPQAVDVYLADMVPPDNDTSWSDSARSKLKDFLHKADYENENSFFSGRIKLQLLNTIWVDNLTLKEYVPDGSLKVYKLSAQSILLKYNLAELRQGILDNLYKLCANAKIELPDYNLPIIKQVKEVPPQVVPNWAHLENGQEYNQVYFCSADNLDRIFLRLVKHQKIFDELIDDIQKAIRQPLYPTNFEVIEGRCYLAKDPEGDQYGRVLVQKLDNDIAHCFFVDHGDYLNVNKSELKFLTDELITKLPFQVIECSLHGIKPKDGTSIDDILDPLYEFAYEPGTDLLRTIYVKIIKKDTPEITLGTKYSIILIDSIKENEIINNYFIENDLADKIINNDFIDDLNFEKLKQECCEQSQVDSEDEFEDFNENVGFNGMEEGEEIEEINDSEVVDEEEVDMETDLKNTLKEMFGSTGLNMDEVDIQLGDIGQFIRDGFKDWDHQPYISRETSNNNSVIPSRALPSSEYSTPNLVWSQTDEDVTIKVKLTGVTKYDLSISRNHIFLFSTSLNEVCYKLNLILFSKIESIIEHEAKGFYVLVKLKKQSIGEWERLVSSKKKLRNITYDPDVLAKEKKVVEEKVPIEFLFDEEDKPKYVYEYGSDVDFDESDACSYDSDSY